MNEAQAQAQADANQAILDGEAITDRMFVILDLFTPAKYSSWGILLIPSEYETQWDAATLEQQYAFYRVSNKAISANYANYVNEFKAIGATDSVLQPYLDL